MNEKTRDKIRHASGWIIVLLTVVLAGLVATLLAGCSLFRAKTATVTPVAIVAWPSPIKPSCEFPPIPGPVVIVGFPDAEKIYVTKRDIEGLVLHESELNNWAQAVTRCLGKISQ